MAIKVNAGFSVGAGVPIDERLVLTKAEMLAINESTMPDVYMACCKDDGKIYVYNKANTPNTDTGKFEELKTGGGSYTLPVATPSDLGGVMPDDVTIKADSAGVISAVDEVHVGSTPPTNGESVWIDTSEDYEGSKFGDIYSTNEVCIGKWVKADGTVVDLYRRIVHSTVVPTSAGTTVFTLPSDILEVVKIDGNIERSNGLKQSVNISFMGSNVTHYSNAYIYSGSLVHTTNLNDVSKCTYILEYIKA